MSQIRPFFIACCMLSLNVGSAQAIFTPIFYTSHLKPAPIQTQSFWNTWVSPYSWRIISAIIITGHCAYKAYQHWQKHQTFLAERLQREAERLQSEIDKLLTPSNTNTSDAIHLLSSYHILYAPNPLTYTPTGAYHGDLISLLPPSAFAYFRQALKECALYDIMKAVENNSEICRLQAQRKHKKAAQYALYLASGECLPLEIFLDSEANKKQVEDALQQLKNTIKETFKKNLPQSKIDWIKETRTMIQEPLNNGEHIAHKVQTRLLMQHAKNLLNLSYKAMRTNTAVYSAQQNLYENILTGMTAQHQGISTPQKQAYATFARSWVDKYTDFWINTSYRQARLL